MRYRPIRRNGEFGRVYARGKSYVNQALVLYVLKTRSKRTRVGLTATKKIGHAVQRNRARRVMKAAIDEHLDYNIGGYDLVFVARGMTPRLKSWQLSAIVAKLFAQAGLPDKAKQPGAKPPATLPPARQTRGVSIFQKALCGLIRLYQRFISPGLGRNCRFSPSCSQYGIEAIRTHGCLKGLLLTGMADRPVQSAGPLGLRPRAGEGPLEKSGPASCRRRPCFPQDTKNKWKTSSSMLFGRALKREDLRQCFFERVLKRGKPLRHACGVPPPLMRGG